jgi:hypothetical protein
MSLQQVSLEELLREVERREIDEQAEIRSQLEDARRLVRELEAKLRAPKSKSAGRQSGAVSTAIRVSLAEKTDKILAALVGRDFTGAGELAGLVGCDVSELPTALQLLVASGKVVRSGQRRGTRYKLA